MINPINITYNPDGYRIDTYTYGPSITHTITDRVLHTTMSYTLDNADSASAHAMLMDRLLRDYEERRLRIVRSYRDIFAPGSVWEQYRNRPMWPLLGDSIGPRICTLVQSISDIRVHIIDYPNTYTASATWVLDHLSEGDGCYEEYALWAESVGETAYTREDYQLVRELIKLSESYLRGGNV